MTIATHNRPRPAPESMNRHACRTETERVFVDAVFHLTKRIFDVERIDIESRRRHDDLVRARAFMVWVFRSVGKPRSYPAIAEAIGERNSSTIINLHEKAILLRMTDPLFRSACRQIAELLPMKKGAMP